LDKKIIILGIGIIGAAAYFLTRSSDSSEIGGTFGGTGESSKKEQATNGYSVTETTTEPMTEPIIYNINLPANVFPSLPDPGLSEPWWVKGLTPPTEKTTSNENIDSKKVTLPTGQVLDAPLSGIYKQYRKRVESQRNQTKKEVTQPKTGLLSTRTVAGQKLANILEKIRR